MSPSALPATVTTEDAAKGAIGVAGTSLVARARFGEGVIYELVWSPEIEARLAPAAPAPPPPPGPPPFAPPERLQYTVKWIGGPLDLAAGHVTLEVAKGASGDAPYRFVATAETAPWMARFFDARDRFETDAGLGPAAADAPAHLAGRASGRSIACTRSIPTRGVVRIGRTGLVRPSSPFPNSSRHPRRADGAVLHPHPAAGRPATPSCCRSTTAGGT